MHGWLKMEIGITTTMNSSGAKVMEINPLRFMTAFNGISKMIVAGNLL